MSGDASRRRSSRERHERYANLNENSLLDSALVRSLLDEANSKRNFDVSMDHHHSPHRHHYSDRLRPTRSTSRHVYVTGDDDDDDDGEDDHDGGTTEDDDAPHVTAKTGNSEEVYPSLRHTNRRLAAHSLNYEEEFDEGEEEVLQRRRSTRNRRSVTPALSTNAAKENGVKRRRLSVIIKPDEDDTSRDSLASTSVPPQLASSLVLHSQQRILRSATRPSQPSSPAVVGNRPVQTHSSAASLREERALLRRQRAMAQQIREEEQLGLGEEEEGKEGGATEPTAMAQEEEEEEEEEGGTRKYMLRERRTPIVTPRDANASSTRYHDSRNRGHSSHRSSHHHRHSSSFHRASPSSHHHRRRHRRRSSSTSTTGDEQQQSPHKHDESRFERRAARSLAKARQRFQPVNMDGSAAGDPIANLLGKKRAGVAVGSSCSDIDPMAIDRTTTFEDVGGLATHVQTIKEMVVLPMLYPELFERFKLQPPRGVLFYGPPGTGKTLMARALANECSKGEKKVAFFMRKGADCLSKWVGESERQLRLLFDQAYSMRPSIIFFDEIDGLAPVRSSRQDQIHSSIVSTLLALMDGLDARADVIVIGATNRLDSLDPALRRPGRFDRELRFQLPDETARRRILSIHTRSWTEEQRPSDEVLDWLATQTSGFCGADLKMLCTESVLVAVRRRWPHLYVAAEKLRIEPGDLRIRREHFENALRRVTPAARRDLFACARPMNERMQRLVGETVKQALIELPRGYRRAQTAEALAATELELVWRSLDDTASLPSKRLVLVGPRNGGQSTLALPVLLGQLDHLPVFSLAAARLLADAHPEELLAQATTSAIKIADGGQPTLILLPQLDDMERVLPPTLWHILEAAIRSIPAAASVLVVASIDRPWEETSREVRTLFKRANAARVELQMPGEEDRRWIIRQALQGREKRQEEDERMPEVPPASYNGTEAKVGWKEEPRKLTETEKKDLLTMRAHLFRMLRIFLRDQLAKLMRDRRFSALFAQPVDVEEAPDYYEVIEHPMCLAQIMDNIDKNVYEHPNQFLDDVRLITSNALEYNPARNLEDRQIRHHAVALRDMAEELLSEVDDAFVEKLERVDQLLSEAGLRTRNGRTEKKENDDRKDGEGSQRSASPTKRSNARKAAIRRKAWRRSGKRHRRRKGSGAATAKRRAARKMDEEQEQDGDEKVEEQQQQQEEDVEMEEEEEGEEEMGQNDEEPRKSADYEHLAASCTDSNESGGTSTTNGIEASEKQSEDTVSSLATETSPTTMATRIDGLVEQLTIRTEGWTPAQIDGLAAKLAEIRDRWMQQGADEDGWERRVLLAFAAAEKENQEEEDDEEEEEEEEEET